MKSIMLAAALVVATTVGASADSWIDRQNAALNTPQSKQAFLARVCAGGDNASFYQCERMKKSGVPDSDIRLALISAGLVVGGAAGMAATSVAIPALGGKTLLAQWGVTHILGAPATVAVAGSAGAAIGVAATGAYAASR